MEVIYEKKPFVLRPNITNCSEKSALAPQELWCDVPLAVVRFSCADYNRVNWATVAQAGRADGALSVRLLLPPTAPLGGKRF